MEAAIFQMAIAIGQRSVVVLAGKRRMHLQLQFVEIGIERGFDVVVVDFAIAEQHVLNAEVEHIGRRAVVVLRGRRQIVGPVFLDDKVDDGMTKNDLFKVYFAME